VAGIDLVNAVGGGDEIVDQPAAVDAKPRSQRTAVEGPRQVGDVGHLAAAAGTDRPGHRHAGGMQAGGVGLLETALEQRLETLELRARVAPFAQHHRPLAAEFDQLQQGLGAPQIDRQYLHAPPPSRHRVAAPSRRATRTSKHTANGARPLDRRGFAGARAHARMTRPETPARAGSTPGPPL
jgi:hypothetical protein